MNKKETIYLKNMYSNSCIKLVELFFNGKDNICICSINLGEVNVEYDDEQVSRPLLVSWFDELGFTIVNDLNVEITEKTKVAAVELIHDALNSNSLVRNSDYISERLQLPYDKISRIFSQVTGTTLATYIILLKMEKAKDLLIGNDYTVSEISYIMEYSSVQYFSNQFKKHVGVTISQYKENPQMYRKPIESII
jgi:AraC-like DNA-binding protein